MSGPTNPHRFLYKNLITIANATMSDVWAGRISQGTKDVSVGGAGGRAGGVYTGLTELQVVVQIDDVSAGASIGTATFKVSYDGGTTWYAGGQATSTSHVTLPGGSGLTFVFSAAASGADFALGDRWRFKDASGTKTLLIDHGTPTAADACFLLSHNLPAGATLTIQRNATDAWGAPSVSQVVPWAAGKMGLLAAALGTYPYSRLVIVPSGTAAPEGKPYLGASLELAAHGLSRLPWEQTAEWYGAKSEGPYGTRRASVESRPERFPLNWPVLTLAEYDQLVVMRNACWDVDGGIYTPILFVPDSTLPAQVHACAVEAFELTARDGISYTGQLLLHELVKLRA